MARVREILISVAGLTPQIITETLYCLTQVRKPPARISEIWVITTVAGKGKVECELLVPRRGWFFRFCDDYALDARKIRFGPDQIVVISDKDGRALEDVRTPEDNAAVADTITSFVRHKALDPNIRLHCSEIWRRIEEWAPIWRYGMAFHRLHGSAAGAVAAYDPRLGAVVIASHTPEFSEGQTLNATPP